MRPFLLAFALLFSAAGISQAAANHDVYGYTMKSIDGQPTSLRQFHGKVVMLVNVASACGYTPQYKELEAVYEKYKSRGFVIIGIPANNFANQESGTDAEIKSFCTRKYQVTFPMMSKVSVLGADKAPLYQFLTDKSLNPQIGGDIQWNFTKFLLGRDGKPLVRFEPAVTPESLQVIAAIESALNSK